MLALILSNDKTPEFQASSIQKEPPRAAEGQDESVSQAAS